MMNFKKLQVSKQTQKGLMIMKKGQQISRMMRKNLTEEKRTHLANAWQELLQPKIQKQLKELEFVRELQISKLRTRESIRAKLSNLQTLLDGRLCPTCGQTVLNIDRVELEKARVDLENQLSQLNYDEEAYNKANQSIRNLKGIKAISIFAAIKYIEKRLTEIRIDTVDLDGKTQELNDRLRSYDISSVIRNRDEYVRITKEIGSLETICDKTEELLTGKKQEAIKLEEPKL